MAVVQTSKWLDAYMAKKDKETSKIKVRKHHQEQISGRLKPYFHHANTVEIHEHLLRNGLFLPSPDDKSIIKSLKEKNCWETVKTSLTKLRKDWHGPDVPVFILPSNVQNRKLQADFNGLSGLSYPDKVFLFVTPYNKKVELEKLLIHEYNHVCRLKHLDKSEANMDLLDSIVLEGLAEMAVEERLGKEHLAKWATLYPSKTALYHWEKWLQPNCTVKRAERRHYELLYGKGFIPRWAGYNAGYHMVSSYVANTNSTIEQMLDVPAETILKESDFPK